MNNKKKYIFIGILIISTLFLFIFIKRSTNKTSILNNNSIDLIHHVSLYKTQASPSDILIKKGEFVEFDSKDGGTHIIASGKGNDYDEQHEHIGTGIESQVFGSDEGYRVQFNEIGTYFFHDHLNPAIAVTVAVYDPTIK